MAQRDVYLPKSAFWYDFWTGKRIEGGQTVKADAPLDRIPLFVKAVQSFPWGLGALSAQDSNQELVIRIYEGQW
jgi:alpha-D-xyloside xylohydrolase